MATETTNETGRSGIGLSNVQVIVAVLFGAVLALIGVAAPLVEGATGAFLGFGRNYLHDAIHLLSGVAGLGAGLYAGGAFADEYNKVLGAVYLLVTVLGFVFFGFFQDLISLNMADNYLHLGLAVVFLGVGFLVADR